MAVTLERLIYSDPLQVIGFVLQAFAVMP